MEKEIIYVDVEKIRNHPQNQRKDVGDVTELAESIKANGIMQNLTLVPDKANAGMYLALIGNRRLKAAKAAGLTRVPCIINENLTFEQEVGIMLTENMQRVDLTVMEQADGFQMMLDLGESIDSIAEKTGFSKPTVKHRVEIAKLDKDTLNNTKLQLSITDFMNLEKIKDIKAREEAIKGANTPAQLDYMINKALQEQKKQETLEPLIKECKKLGLEEVDPYNNDYEYRDYKEYAHSLEDIKEIIEKHNNVKHYAVGKWDTVIVLFAKNENPEKEYKEPEETEEEKKIREIEKTLSEIENKIKDRLHILRKANDEYLVIDKILALIVKYIDGISEPYLTDAEAKEYNKLTLKGKCMELLSQIDMPYMYRHVYSGGEYQLSVIKTIKDLLDVLPDLEDNFLTEEEKELLEKDEDYFKNM